MLFACHYTKEHFIMSNGAILHTIVIIELNISPVYWTLLNYNFILDKL